VYNKSRKSSLCATFSSKTKSHLKNDDAINGALQCSISVLFSANFLSFFSQENWEFARIQAQNQKKKKTQTLTSNCKNPSSKHKIKKHKL
jgi:hypothetical protein